MELNTNKPIISFTFDDFPRTAILNGGKILNENSIKGSFYVSLKLVGSDSPSGKIATYKDIEKLFSEGHELGCHTYNHFDALYTKPDIFLKSINRNAEELNSRFPNKTFKTFAYPKTGPTLAIKKIVGRHFFCCRGGANMINRKSTDLNLLNSYFLDWRIGGAFAPVKKMIDYNNSCNGWLIFSTHDISTNPSRYGCKIELFDQIVQYAANSNAIIASICEVSELLGISDNKGQSAN